MKPSISIVVNARNEAEAITAQRDAGDIEIILVDDRTADGTA